MGNQRTAAVPQPSEADLLELESLLHRSGSGWEGLLRTPPPVPSPSDTGPDPEAEGSEAAGGSEEGNVGPEPGMMSIRLQLKVSSAMRAADSQLL